MFDQQTAAQNGQPDLSNVFFFPTRDQLEMWAKKDAESNTASSPAANNVATAQNSPFDLSNVISSLIGNEIAADQNSDKTARDNPPQTNSLHNEEIQGKLVVQNIESGAYAQNPEIEIQEAEVDDRNGWIEQKSEDLSKEEKSGMLSEDEIKALGKALANVSHPSDSFLLNPDQKNSLRKVYRQMLTYASNLSRNTELTMLFRMNMTQINMIVGEPGAGHVDYNVPNEDFISVHNHPDGRTFSEDDIRNIIECDKQRIVIAVGHNGNVYVLEKHPDFKGTRAALALKFYRDFIAQHPNRTQNAETYIADMEELIKGVEKYGIFYFSSRN